MTVPDYIPPIVTFAFGTLIQERGIRREFYRVYGRERGADEYACRLTYQHDVTGRMSNARSTLREALRICGQNGWNWKAVCAMAIAQTTKGVC